MTRFVALPAFVPIRGGVVLTLWAGLAFARVASAQTPSATQAVPEEGVRLAGEGAEAYKAGRFAEALTKLAAAYRVSARPETLLMLANTELKLGRCEQANAHAGQYVAAFQAKAQSLESPASLLAQVKTMCSDVTLTSDPPGASVVLTDRGDVSPTVTPWHGLLPVGEHAVLARLKGYVDQRAALHVLPGQVATLHLVFKLAPPPRIKLAGTFESTEPGAPAPVAAAAPAASSTPPAAKKVSPPAKAAISRADDDSDDTPAPPEPPPVYDPQPWSHTRFSLTLGLEAGVGAYTGDQNSPGFLSDLKLDALVHFRHFTLGVTGEGGTVNFTNYDWIAGVTGGPAWDFGRGRLMALVEAGVHQIGAIGAALFNSAALNNVTALVPEAGVNARYVWVGAANHTVSFVAIFEAFARFDLERVHTSYQAQVCTSDGGCNVTTIPATAGGVAAGVGASIGALF